MRRVNDPAGNMNMLAITLGLFTSICILKSATGQDIQTTCPGFTEGVPSTIDCTVNRTYYDSICLTAPVRVTFQFLNGGSPTQWCDTSYTACETTGQSQTDCNGCSCQCSHKNLTTKFNKYSLTFVPNATYNGGSFYCEITCSFPSSPETKDHTSCANAKVATTTTTTTTITTTANPCLGHTCRSKPGCPCDCPHCWYGTECTDFSLVCLLSILLVLIIIIISSIIGCLCHYCGNDEIRCCCCWMGCCCCACAIAVFCCELFADTGGTGEEVQCKCVYRNRQHSRGGKNRKPPGGQQAPKAPSDPSSNSGVTGSSKMNQEKLETQEKEEEHSNKPSVSRPMVYPNASIASEKEVGVQSTGFKTIPPLTPVNGNSYTKKTDPLPPIAKQSNK